MLVIILLVLLLVYVQTLLPGRYLAEQVGAENQMGPRDDLPAPSRELQRSRRALNNLQETLPIFLTLAVLSVVFAENGWLSIAGGIVYLAARIAHVVCYLRGLSPWRSIAYLVSLIGMALVALPVVGHIFA
jgi:uncharacterized MAPEG superfamily protein